MDKVYLGDSVYVYINRSGQIVLTTQNGWPGDPSNTIYMEPEVYQALVGYVNRVMAEPSAPSDIGGKT